MKQNDIAKSDKERKRNHLKPNWMAVKRKSRVYNPFVSALGSVQTILDSSCAGAKTISSVHTYEWSFRRGFCNGVELCRADLEGKASHIG